MKLLKIFPVIVLLFLIGSTDLKAQKIRSLDKSPLDVAVFRPDGKNADPVARIIYSRPFKKEREIFGGLVDYGKVWRTGANQTTELNVFKEIKIDGKTIAPGSYSFYTIPNKDSWTIILNSKLYTWGAYDYDESKDVMRFKVPVTTVDNIQENFGIAFKGNNGKGKILLAWDTTEVYIDFEYD